MPLIYLDVTSSCKSPLNTGVQRVVRGIYRELRSHFEVVPLIWSPAHDSYCRLSEREMGFLENPFAKAHTAAVPDRQGRGPVWSRWWRHFLKRKAKINLSDPALGPILLFVPEIFQDSRIEFFAGLPPSVKKAAVFHDAITYLHPELSGNKRQENFARYMKALTGFDLVATISAESRDALESFWKESSCAAAPIRIEYLPGEFRNARKICDPDFHAKKILVVSTLERRKNHLGFLDACEILWQEGCPFEAELIGRSAKEGGSEVVARIQELQKKKVPIVWRQHVDDNQVEESYQKCSFTVYPSFYEGFGMPILESLWNRRPCICGSNGALGEVSTGGGCIATNQNNPQVLAGAMRSLLEDESLYQNKVSETKQREFRSWKDYGATLAGHLQKLQ